MSKVSELLLKPEQNDNLIAYGSRQPALPKIFKEEREKDTQNGNYFKLFISFIFTSKTATS
ncbi:MAG: hypothetical protein ABI863_12770 [Ginsengibacter sp.]